MNWRRGFTRAWVVLSLLWCAAVVVDAVKDYRTTVPGITFATDEPGCNDDKFIPVSCERTVDVAIHKPLWTYLSFALGPPVGLAVAGLMIGWIGAGFRRV